MIEGVMRDQDLFLNSSQKYTLSSVLVDLRLDNDKDKLEKCNPQSRLSLLVYLEGVSISILSDI
jgi:hypothetical protein